MRGDEVCSRGQSFCDVTQCKQIEVFVLDLLKAGLNLQRFLDASHPLFFFLPLHPSTCSYICPPPHPPPCGASRGVCIASF